MIFFGKKTEKQRLLIMIVREGQGTEKAEFAGDPRIIDAFVAVLRTLFEKLEADLKRRETL